MMSEDFSSDREKSALASMTLASDDLQAYLDATDETTQKQLLPNAVAAINWIGFDARNPRYGRTFNACCRQCRTESKPVSRLFFGSFIKYWTEATHRVMVETIGVQKMRTVYTFADSL